MGSSSAINTLLQELLQEAQGVVVDERNDDVLLIGPEGQMVSVRYHDEAFYIESLEFGES